MNTMRLFIYELRELISGIESEAKNKNKTKKQMLIEKKSIKYHWKN